MARLVGALPHKRRWFDQKCLYNSMDYTWFGRERAPAGEPEAILTYIGVSCEMPKGKETGAARPAGHPSLVRVPSI